MVLPLPRMLLQYTVCHPLLQPMEAIQGWNDVDVKQMNYIRFKMGDSKMREIFLSVTTVKVVLDCNHWLCHY